MRSHCHLIIRRTLFHILSATNDDAEEQYCLIRWSDDQEFSVVPQRKVQVSSSSIKVYETYTIESDGKERKGKVIMKGIFIGSY